MSQDRTNRAGRTLRILAQLRGESAADATQDAELFADPELLPPDLEGLAEVAVPPLRTATYRGLAPRTRR